MDRRLTRVWVTGFFASVGLSIALAGCTDSDTEDISPTRAPGPCAEASADNMKPAEISSYESDGTTLRVFAWGRPGEELAAVCAIESETEVRVRASRRIPAGPVEDMRVALEAEIVLTEPVGDRAVVDGDYRDVPHSDGE
jgi:hypothetical protein